MAQVNKALGYERRGYLLLLVNKQTNLISENQTVPGLGRPIGHQLVAGNGYGPSLKICACPVIRCFPAKHKVGLLQYLPCLFTICQALEQKPVKPRLALS